MLRTIIVWISSLANRRGEDSSHQALSGQFLQLQIERKELIGSHELNLGEAPSMFKSEFIGEDEKNRIVERGVAVYSLIVPLYAPMITFLYQP